MTELDGAATLSQEHVAALAAIRQADAGLHQRFADRSTVNRDLDRTLVSFQANKTTLCNRWCKYKEGFSADLVRYALDRTGLVAGKILDPFAGSGTALFAASHRGLDAVGIELLDSSAEITEVRSLAEAADRDVLADKILQYRDAAPWRQPGELLPFPHLRITAGAFPAPTEQLLGRFLAEAARVQDPLLARIARFAAMCVLESISYTRKDGQYLRWDHRSGRGLGRRAFDKGKILGFDEAIAAKLAEIAHDLVAGQPGATDVPQRRPTSVGRIELLRGSCLEILPTLHAKTFDGLITSPPYCNRYDYTRTYALELAMLGVGEEGIRRLRQTMLSCTVENREKQGLAQVFHRRCYAAAMRALESQQVLQLILQYLEACRDDGSLNNAGIPRMVRNYFAELTLLIFEIARVLKPGAPCVMVNDNVRYQGAHIPVDLILADIAEQAGFTIEAIWALPRGKGNSSQQMGLHGREETRKCVYVWRR